MIRTPTGNDRPTSHNNTPTRTTVKTSLEISFKFKVQTSFYLICPIWAYRTQHAHSDVIVKQYNIMSTQVIVFYLTMVL